MMADISKFTDIPLIDASIEEYEYHEYDPITGTNLNNGGDIRIRIQSQDMFTQPSDSYLIFRVVYQRLTILLASMQMRLF